MDHLITDHKDQDIINRQHQTFIKIKEMQIKLIFNPHIQPQYVLYNDTTMEHEAVQIITLPVIIKIRITQRNVSIVQ
uniref:Uncharacterized protein n=1 Tax=Romanomermis culicivorax TaxID=13658 RepID=A0A915IUJ5_ROMCU